MSPPATPLEPVAAILDAFQSHRIVALGEGAHGNLPAHAFRLSLLRDPRFSVLVDAIVIEFGNARWQDLSDRYVRGEEMSDEALRLIWLDTTQPQVLEFSIYAEFFREVRRLNATAPAQHQLRVLLGDPPVDWSRTDARGMAEIRRQQRERTRYPAALIQREVIAKGQRALLVWGDGHFPRRPDTLVGVLERESTVRVFSVMTNTFADLRRAQPDVERWPAPSLAWLPGTRLGAAALRDYLPGARETAGTSIAQRFDGVLYLGAPDTIRMSPLAPGYCDRDALNRRLARLALLADDASMMMAASQRLRCDPATLPPPG